MLAVQCSQYLQGKVTLEWASRFWRQADAALLAGGVTDISVQRIVSDLLPDVAADLCKQHPDVQGISWHNQSLADRLAGTLPACLHAAACSLCIAPHPQRPEQAVSALILRVGKASHTAALVHASHCLAQLGVQHVHVQADNDFAMDHATQAALQAFLHVAARLGIEATLSIQCGEQPGLPLGGCSHEAFDAAIEHSHSMLTGLQLRPPFEDRKYAQLVLPFAQKCSALRSLRLHHYQCGPDSHVADGSAWASVLHQLPASLTQLHIHGAISLRTMLGHLPESIATHTSLLDLALQPAQFEQLLPPLHALSQLMRLQVPELPEIKCGDEHLLADLLKALTNLQDLCLPVLEPAALPDDAQLFRSFNSLLSLTHLEMPHSLLARGNLVSAAKLAKHISVLQKLAHLELHGSFSDSDASLAGSLAELPAVLHLSWWHAGRVAVVALCPALARWTGLEDLALPSCCIDDDACCKLAAALSQPNALQTLNLIDNRIGGPGVTALARVFQNKGSLREVNLDCNTVRGWDVWARYLRATVKYVLVGTSITVRLTLPRYNLTRSRSHSGRVNDDDLTGSWRSSRTSERNSCSNCKCAL